MAIAGTPRKVLIPQHCFEPVGCCIYCGSEGDPDLRREHIIPSAIDGRLILPAATCHECEVKTGAVDGRVIHRVFGHARFGLGMRRGHRRKWDPNFKIHVNKSDRKPRRRGMVVEQQPDLEGFEPVEISASDHPGGFLGYNLPPAGIFRGVQTLDDMNFHSHSFNVYGPLDFKERLKKLGPGGSVIIGGASDRVMTHDDFGRFLAKIAHSYAAATIGIKSFAPFLANACRDERPMHLSHYVGGLARWDPCDTDHLHLLQNWSFKTLAGNKVFVIRIRLFACYYYPAYDVAVGEATATP